MALALPRNRLLLLLALLALIVVGLAWAWARNGRSRELVLYGNVDIREVTIGFRVAGRVEKLDVDEGDAVTAGEEIARLDPVPLELEANEARANAASLGRRLDLLQKGYRSELIGQGRATVAEQEAALTQAEQNLVRQEQLKGTGAVAQRVYDDALAARDEARARLKSARENLAQLEYGYQHQEVAEGEANHQRALAASAQAEQRLKDTVLFAPADGVVLTRAVERGAILAAGTPVFTISLRAPVWAVIYVDEGNLGRVAPGQSVLLYTDARPERPYHGKVGYVSPTAEFTPKNVETPELRTALVYRARIVVSDADEALRQGMPVTVHFAPGGTRP
ncbi:MAG TPA: secretion protein HlyD [Steroidobacteraceae bacterium]|nr:secretion protein HlyD [Steroidobacteraceae bacterium]